ncbi:MAG TPA: PorT family protein [Candidatus Parabacteroides intestinigallinarum]|uniref:PorT family protein n=1 Tax=Candidatus Parabacteroides intestinigallinarum TaxID=2838722 RepID=A0A9D1XTA5_9BACT|nr:PorT family protein [Candidatus Parabacteroides intestinigallinarum]
MIAMGASAQKERVKNQPYADLKWFHLGFHVGIHTQDLLLTHSGVTTDGETWFAEIPSYSPGFSVGVIGDMYLNPYFNLRLTPSIHFGDKKFTFREQETGEEFTTNVRSSYLNFPLDIKYSALRLNNYRPYLIAGVYGSIDIGRKKGNPILLKSKDFGLEFGLGCDIYLPYFKLCPELKFCFGLVDLLEKDRPDLVDQATIKYTNALSKATSRMIILTFNFE